MLDSRFKQKLKELCSNHSLALFFSLDFFGWSRISVVELCS